MLLSDLLSWLNTCPHLDGKAVFPDYLPAYEGWSCAVAKQETRTDILGTRRQVLTLTLTRRITVQNEAERLALLEKTGAVVRWCAANPMPGTRVRPAGLPVLTARSPSGTEDAAVTFCVTEC